MFFLLIGALQIPYIQTKLTQKATTILSEKLNYPITVRGVDISWLDTAILEEVCVQDNNKDTLLYIQETYIDFQLLSLFSSNIKIDNVFLVNPKMNILYQKNNDQLNINHFINALVNLFKKEDNNTDNATTNIEILTATLHNASFEYYHTKKDSIKNIDETKQFNANHFSIVNVFTHLEKFNIQGDTIRIDIIHLSGHEKNHDFTIKDLNTQFLYTSKCLEFGELDAYIQNSYLSEYIRFDYEHLHNFGKFIDSVKITANLNKSIIYSKDLGYFVPDLLKYDDEWKISGNVRGTISNLKLKKFEFAFGNESKISGNINLEGLPKIQETFMQIHVKESLLNPNDLKQYLPTEYLDIAYLFGKTHFSTNLTGFSTNFVTDGLFKTSIGTIDTDLKFDINKKNQALSYYKGEVKTENFNLGKFLAMNQLGKLDMEGKIEGKGFKIENAQVRLDAKIHRLGFNNYDYTNISTDSAFFDKKSFHGAVSIKDPNLNVDIDGSFSLDGNQSVFNVNTSVKTANLLPLHLTKDDIRFEIGFSTLVFEGLKLDSIRGKGLIANSKIFYNNDSLPINFLSLDIKLNENQQKIVKLYSEYATVEMNGDFDFEDTYKELLYTINEYTAPFYNKEEKLVKNKYKENHHLFYNIELTNINPILNFIEPKLYIENNSKFFGQFMYGKEHNLQLHAVVDSFAYDKFAGKENTFFIDSHKSEKNLFEANYQLHNSYFYVENKPQMENTNIEALWKKDTIAFSSDFKQFNRSNTANLIGEIGLGKEKIGLHFIESEVNILKDKWVFPENNFVNFYKDSTVFTDFYIESNEQKIGLYGSYGKKESNLLSIKIEKFNLQNLKKISDIDLEGLASSDISIENFKDKQQLDGNLKIKKLATQGTVIGDIEGSWYWDNYLKWFVSNTKIVRNKRLILSLNGFYNFNDTINPLHYNIRFERTPLTIVEEFVGQHISNVKGYIDGNVQVGGNFKKPTFNGSPMLHCQGLTVNYLQTSYRFNDEITFKGDSILFKNFQLDDTKELSKIRVNGGIKHQFFNNLESNLRLHLDNSLLMDTKKEHNPLFYGKILASGNVHIKGAFDDLTISSKELRTEKGSAIYIPLNSEETISAKDYIKFVNRNLITSEIIEQTELLKKKVEENINLSGLLIDLNLFITPDTYFEIIFDEDAGEKIKAWGGGNVQVVVDTRGDFKMSGVYEIKKGSYNFTLANLINKKFEIAPNSKISWNGSPYDGNLNIQARYQQLASLIPLINDTTFINSNPTVRNGVKTSVLLNLTGSLLSPQIQFGIEIPNYPRYFEVEQAVQNFFSTINFNEQELNKQVFSLIALKQFSPLNQFSVNVGSTSAGTVSELLSNQFSSWISQFDENLQIDINLSGFDEEKNNLFRVRLAYSLLDGKIRLTREGNVTNVDNQQQLSNIFGEWTIEYLITNDGKIKMKAYNRNQNNMITSATGSNNTSMIYGVSLTHTADFDNLRELFKKNENTQEVETFDEPIDTSVPIDSTKVDSTLKKIN